MWMQIANKGSAFNALTVMSFSGSESCLGGHTEVARVVALLRLRPARRKDLDSILPMCKTRLLECGLRRQAAGEV